MPRAGLRQETIVEHASEFINEYSLEQLSLGKLAKLLKVKPPSLYNHIASLDELKNQLALKALRLLKQDLLKATVAKTHEEALRALAHTYRSFALKNPGLFQASLRMVEDRAEAIEREGYEILELILSIFKGFGLEGDSALHATRSLRAILAGFVLLEQSQGFGMPLDLEESFDKHVQMFVIGLSAF